MKPEDINKIVEFIKEQTDFKGDIFININNNAIPIEWLKKWVEKCNWHYTDLPCIIETMIEDWEKENENI